MVYQFSSECGTPQVFSDATNTGVFVSTVQGCGVVQVEIPQVGFSLTSLDSDLMAFFVGGALLMWATGQGIGWIVAIIRRGKI